MSVPKVIFGKCPRCGGGGGDYSDPGDGFADPTDTEGNGYPLRYYKGDLMCEMCIKQVKADDESMIASEKHQEGDEFRSKAGFTHTIED